MPNFEVLCVPTQPKGTCLVGFHWTNPPVRRFVTASELKELKGVQPGLLHVIEEKETDAPLTKKDLESRNTTIRVPPPPDNFRSEGRLKAVEKALEGLTSGLGVKDATIADLRAELAALKGGKIEAPAKPAIK